MEERLQKILARAGYGSRRANEELIEAGRVRVNGEVAALGAKADPEKDTISVDGAAIGRAMPEFLYIALHKPRNVLSDEDPQDSRQTVRDLVPLKGHLFAVGRLDFDSEGLILLTNDGLLANRLTHPRYEHEKEYRVLVAVRPDEEQLATWRRGVVLEDGYRTQPAKVMVEGFSGKGTWLRVVLKEGKKRQIREVGKRIGLPVVRIIRIRIGTLELGTLHPREWRHLTAAEVRDLKSLEKREKAAPSSRSGGRRPGKAAREQTARVLRAAHVPEENQFTRRSEKDTNNPFPVRKAPRPTRRSVRGQSPAAESQPPRGMPAKPRRSSTRPGAPRPSTPRRNPPKR